jgi:hypothetical protein
MAAENRLSAEQLAALVPGDPVTIESGQDLGRRRHVAGTIVRIEGSRVVVSCKGPRGATFIEHYGLHDGFRVGRGQSAELVTMLASPTSSEDRRRTAQIDLLYRDWTRDRTDIERLRRLHEAIEESLGLLTR